MNDWMLLREQMVSEQLKTRGIYDPSTLKSMETVPRHEFVPMEIQSHAYEDRPLPIGEGQTISQPYIVALMTQAAKLTPDSIVLEIGTGSGYAAAVLAHIVKEVYTIERIKQLADSAVNIYGKLGYKNIHVKAGDGTLGWPEHAKYDVILVTAGAPATPKSLVSQLKLGGRLIIPEGDALSQKLMRYTKVGEDEISREILEYVRFVPLIGEEGW